MSRTNISIFAIFDVAAFEKSSQAMQRKMREAASNLKSIGSKMTIGLTAPIIGALGLAAKEFAEFDQTMQTLKAITPDLSDNNFAVLTQQAKDLGISTRFTAQEVGNLMVNYSKLGFSSYEINKITESTLMLANATGEDLAEAATVAGGTLRGFGLEASEMERVTNVMAMAFTNSALDLEKWKVSVSKVAPIAKALGISIEEVAAMFGVLADSNIEASIIGTSMRKIFLNLASSGASYEEAMAAIGRASVDLSSKQADLSDQVISSAEGMAKASVAEEIFEKRAVTAALTLEQFSDKIKTNTELFGQWQDVTGDGTTALKRMSDQIDKSLKMSFIRLQSAASGLGIEFGEVLAPALHKVASFLATMAIKFAGLNDRTKKFIVISGLVVAAIGPLVLGLGAVAVAMTSIAAAAGVTAGSLIAIIAAVAVVGLAIYAFVTNITDNVDAAAIGFHNLGVSIKNNILNALMDVSDGFTQMFADLGIDISSANKKFKKFLHGLGGQFKEPLEFKNFGFDENGKVLMIEKAKEIVKATQKAIEDALGRTVSTVDTPSPLAIDDKGIIGKGLKSVGLSSEEWIKALDAKPLLESTKSLIQKEVDKMGLIIPLDLDLDTRAIGDSIAQFKDDVKAGFENFATDIAMFLADSLGKAIAGAFEGKDFGKGALEVIAGFMQQMGALMIAYAMQMALFNASVKDPSRWPLALAAGVAMVAIGSWITATANKGLDGGAGVATPSYSGSGVNYNSRDFSNEVRIEGREMVITQRREGSFRR